MRTPFIAGNWKMFKTVHEAVVFTKELRSLVKDVGDVEIVIAPPFTAIHAVAEAARNTNVGVSSQDLYWEREGAFTGEISPGMVLEAGAAYAIIGHSERRRLFGETDATVNRKLIISLAERGRFPAIYPYRYFVEGGGLISYGVDAKDLFRRAPEYVGRILRGAKPADLPVQAPTKFELAINLKTAKALNLDVPKVLLATADALLE